MRLTCPRCSAQYQIADTAIPPTGREVECSACGNVWHQEGLEKSTLQPAVAPVETRFDPEARPVLNRALDESVLSILREEAARELRVRKGEAAEPEADHIPATAAVMGDADAEPAPQIDWPATTVTVDEPAEAPILIPPFEDAPPPAAPAPKAATPKATAPESAVTEPAVTETVPEDEPAAEPPLEEPALDEPPFDELVVEEPATEDPVEPDWPEPVLPALPDAAELAATLTRPAAPLSETVAAPQSAPLDLETARTSLRPATPEEPIPAPAQPAAPLPVAPPAARRSGYATGFGLAAMLALGVVAVYALAPQIPADKGGALLSEWRDSMDRGRIWLHDRVLGN